MFGDGVPAELYRLRALFNELRAVVGHVDGINDERDSVPILLAVRDIVNRAMSEHRDIAILREVETNWLADQLGEAIANLGYPVGCGIAPHRDTLMKAANKLFDRYSKMIEMAAAPRLAK